MPVLSSSRAACCASDEMSVAARSRERAKRPNHRKVSNPRRNESALLPCSLAKENGRGGHVRVRTRACAARQRGAVALFFACAQRSGPSRPLSVPEQRLEYPIFGSFP